MKIALQIGIPLPSGFRPGAAAAFSPSDIAGLKLWLKDTGTFQTVDGTPATADGDPVGEWEDQSGTANHYTQATAGLRPVLKTGANGINSLSVVRCDGTDDYLQNLTLAFTSDIFTAFYVVRRNGAPGGVYSNILILGVTSYTVAGVLFYQSYTDSTDKHHANFVSAAVTCDDPTNMGTSPILFTEKYTTAGGGVSTLYRSGVSVDTGAGLVTIGDNIASFLGSWDSNDFNGDVGEIIIYDTALSDANRQSVEAYLNTRWGL